MLGTSLQSAGDLDGAVAAYRAAIRVAPQAVSWANLGVVEYARGETRQALHAFEEAARLEPRSPTIRREPRRRAAQGRRRGRGARGLAGRPPS